MREVRGRDDHGIRIQLVQQVPVTGHDAETGLRGRRGCHAVGLLREADDLDAGLTSEGLGEHPPPQTGADDTYREHVRPFIMGWGVLRRG